MESIFDKILEAYSVLYQKYHKSASFKDLPKCERVFLAVSTLILVKGLVQLTTGGASVFNAIVDMLIAGVLLFCIAKLPKIPRRYTNQQKNNELKEILAQNGISSSNAGSITLINEYLTRKMSKANPYDSLKKVFHLIATILSITIPTILSVTNVSLNFNDAKILIGSIILLVVDGNLLVYAFYTLLEPRINKRKIIMQHFLDDLSELQLINDIEQCI